MPRKYVVVVGNTWDGAQVVSQHTKSQTARKKCTQLRKAGYQSVLFKLNRKKTRYVKVKGQK